MSLTLREQLDGAQIVMADNDAELTLAWFGGHGIHAYTDDGREVAFWNVGDFSKQDADEDVVRESMCECIAKQDYHNRY
jgi:hypothetical protein